VAYNLKKLLKWKQTKVETAVMAMKKAEKTLAFYFFALLHRRQLHSCVKPIFLLNWMNQKNATLFLEKFFWKKLCISHQMLAVVFHVLVVKLRRVNTRPRVFQRIQFVPIYFVHCPASLIRESMAVPFWVEKVGDIVAVNATCPGNDSGKYFFPFAFVDEFVGWFTDVIDWLIAFWNKVHKMSYFCGISRLVRESISRIIDDIKFITRIKERSHFMSFNLCVTRLQ
jgi:hypothetical protein